MKIFKGSKRKPNKVRQFHIARYFGLTLIFLSICLLPFTASAFPHFFSSKYWLLADAAVLFGFGALLENRLQAAQKQDLAETDLEYGGDNATTLLFFATPILWIFNIAVLVHIYALWHFGTPPTVDLALRMQIGGVAAGLVFFLFGQISPSLSFQSKFGFNTKHNTQHIDVWKKSHALCGYILTGCGIALLLLNLFVVTGAVCLYSAVLFAVIGFGACYAIASHC